MKSRDLALELSQKLLQYGTSERDLAKALLWLHRGPLLWTGVLRFLNTAVQFLPALILGPLLTAIKLGAIDITS